MVREVPLLELFQAHRAGYWGGEAGSSEIDCRVIRNGDVLTSGEIRWSELPLRGVRLLEAERAAVHAGDLVLTTSGDCGHVARIGGEPSEPTCVSNFVRLLRVDHRRADPDYVFHFMARPAFRSSLRPFIRGTALKNLATETALKAAMIPIPDLHDQRASAAALDRILDVRRLRQRVLDESSHLAKAIFLEMFTDAGEQNWPLVNVDSLAAARKGAIRTGPFGSQLLHSEFVSDGVAVLGIDNAVHNEFRWDKRRFITREKYEQLRRYTVHPGDVLITIMGTCGRCAIVPDDIPVAINTKHLCCITLDQTQCLPIYLQSYFLWHPVARDYLVRRAKGAIMAGLNMAIIKELPVYVPPLDVQREYERRAIAVGQLLEQNRAAIRSIDELFASAADRIFSRHAIAETALGVQPPVLTAG